ncbi:MAG: ribonuclease H-like YkuK family protein [Saprospiraceae bacterium]|nr:ribonuclease H-like YkuK family protein [Saprospiraceae bacterium]HMW39373.1 ribonuclease H-like YkuK family protein [Saprospiraceae bacterium]HMX88408.1 ribonuclease H-like YkuK family protein [Saprospiraceae bacterium]HMZ39050.1 ribonuclease H-like YkuK family protein [Saprospiraceae bacterium]HNA65455.1 ribonuclease H-like YkuK family protein [Saprospiraceae bacterium]
MNWRTFSGQEIIEPIAERVEHVIQSEIASGYRLKVCIGTDSRVIGHGIDFATVIVFLREGQGGFMFVNNSHEEKEMSLNQRMITEVAKSIQIAFELCGKIEHYNIPLEVHADINTDPGFKSNAALKEAMGYILSMGFIFKAKPKAFASSYCADKMI